MIGYRIPYFDQVVIFRMRHTKVLTASSVMQVAVFPSRSWRINRVGLSVEESKVSGDKTHNIPYFGV